MKYYLLINLNYECSYIMEFPEDKYTDMILYLGSYEFKSKCIDNDFLIIKGKQLDNTRNEIIKFNEKH